MSAPWPESRATYGYRLSRGDQPGPCGPAVPAPSGGECEKEGWRAIIHRRKRCDLSLSQLGLRMLEHFLNEDLPIPVQFRVTI